MSKGSSAKILLGLRVDRAACRKLTVCFRQGGGEAGSTYHVRFRIRLRVPGLGFRVQVSGV